MLTHEHAAQEIDRLFRKALKKEGVDGLKDLLGFMQRFRRFSAWNAAMIRLQRPGAGPVATTRQWDDAGRSVSPDAIPIVILQPFGPINLVYEYKDTLPSPQNSVDGDPFATVGTVTEDVMSRLVTAHWEEDKIGFRLVEYGQLQAGTAARLTTNLGSEAERASGAKANGKVRYRVSVAKTLSLTQQFTTLAHELGHIYCGHLGGGAPDAWIVRQGHLTDGQKELEAESVAYLVAMRAGIGLNSDQYLSGCVAPEDIDAISIDAIIRAVSRIEGFAKLRRTFVPRAL